MSELEDVIDRYDNNKADSVDNGIVEDI